MNFSNALALECKEKLYRSSAALTRAGNSADSNDQTFDPQLYLTNRILEFPFQDYPDSTVPWHLLTWPGTVRWEHVYHVISLIELFKQPTGARVGHPMTLQPFQLMIILAFLGPEDEEGHRQITEGLLTIARKSGKTAIVAALTLALMILHPDDHGLLGQDIQVGASDREQAGVTFKMIHRFITQDDIIGLPQKFRIVPSSKFVEHVKTVTNLKCLSSDAYRAHGGNPIIVLLDEIGNVPNNQAEEFYSVLTTGFGAQIEPFTALFSTQAPTDQHFFSLQVDRAKRVNEGMLEAPHFAGFCFEVPEQDEDDKEIEPFDERYWHLGNPGLGTITSWKDIREWAKKAQDLPSLQNKFENLRLNRRVSETAAFLSRRVWRKNDGRVELDRLKGRDAYLGLDLAETTDLCSLAIAVEPEEAGEPISLWAWFWVPGNGLQARVDRDKVPYDAWARDELIDVESHDTVDRSRIAKRIEWCFDNFEILGFGYDRWRMKTLRKALAEENEDLEWDKDDPDSPLIEIGQGYRDQMLTVEIMEELAVSGRLAHGKHPILNWCIANTVTTKDPAGNRKFDKARSFGRIDGTVAVGLALHVRHIVLGDEARGGSSFNDMERDIIM